MNHELTLPRRRIKITFRSPKTEDKRRAIRDFSSESKPQSKGFNLEEAIAACCITSIDGEQVNSENDLLSEPYDLQNDWEFADSLYYQEVFANMFFMDEKGKAAAAEEAKKILGASPN